MSPPAPVATSSSSANTPASSSVTPDSAALSTATRRTVAPSTAAPFIDASLRRLQERKRVWASLPLREKVSLLQVTRSNLKKAAERWVAASVGAKQIDPASPWVGEEWVTGPWALAAGINGYLRTLEALAAGRRPPLPKARTRDGGQVMVRVFPADLSDWLLLNGLTADVWMQPGVTVATLDDHVAAFYRQQAPQGRVTLVLGAGNVNAIAPLDVLYMLFVHGSGVMLKLNPVNDYLGPILEEVFEPLMLEGFVQIAYGGSDVGAYLTAHPDVDAVHMTGSARTFDAIVYGAGPEGAERKRRRQPALTKPVTSELGGVGPCIVVPGPWTDADLRFQAENIATMKLHNSGCNCVALQVLVLPRAWDLSARLLDEVRRVMEELPPRPAYYPGCDARQRAAVEAHATAELLGEGQTPRTLIAGLDPQAREELCFREEMFGPVLAQTSLEGETPQAFLANAVRFANDTLDGTLGATLLVHPATLRELGPAFEQALAELRYGSIGVNVWNAAGFLLAQAPWGAYPGHTADDIQSGTGFVHNTFMLDGVEKSVVRGSFYPFPRSWLHGDAAFLPKPPWFVTNRTAHTTSRRVAAFAMDPSLRHLPGIFASALRG